MTAAETTRQAPAPSVSAQTMMRAAVWHGPGDLRLEHRRIPVPAAGEVLVAVRAAGVCGTDIHELHHGPVITPLRQRHPLTGHLGPMVLGHEFSGEVVDAGPGTSLRRGTMISSGSGVSCGACPACRTGWTNLCQQYWTVGFHRDGALAEYCAVPESVCVPLGDRTLTADAAALAQPMSIAVHAARRGSPTAGSSVLVLGAGGIGAFLVAALRVAGGVGRIVVMEPDPARRDVALALGADEAIAPGSAEPGAFETVYEVSGSAAGLTSAVSAAARGGRIVLVGIQPPAVAGDDTLRQATLHELQLVGTSAHVLGVDFPTALDVLAEHGDWTLVAPRAGTLAELVTQLTRPADGLGPIKRLFDPAATRSRAAQYVTSERAAAGTHSVARP
jgi:(R,R)-butanediol dehydrogenase/meso-butanediol dehydrogenase/diacetyl reductase